VSDESGDEAMAAEFDTLAEWTAEAALALGPDHHIPAGCRGSGRPAALDWLLDRLEVHAGAPLVDVGAGVGGPGAYAAQRRGVHPLLFEPAAGAGRAARRLFGSPVARCDAAALPVADAAVRTGWSLGVLCTVDEQLGMLRELRRVLHPDGRAGLLVFVATRAQPPAPPEGNEFPTFARLHRLIADAGLRAVDQHAEAALAAEPPDWRERQADVEREIERRHGQQREWHTAQHQSQAIARLLRDGDVVGHLLVVARS
jgi:SAM-dependent methyltransferase